MILILAIIAGFLAGWLRAQYHKRSLRMPAVRRSWIVLVAVTPQLMAFNIRPMRSLIPDSWIPFILIGSQILLLIFVWYNLNQPGFWVLGIGLLLNFLVIALNGGWMPISPEVVKQIAPDAPSGSWSIEERLGVSKDKVMLRISTRLPLLSDCIILPQIKLAGWMPFQVAFSIGDVLIAAGALWFLWSLGGPTRS